MTLSPDTIGWIFVALATVGELIGVFGLSLYSRNRSALNAIIYYGGLAASFTLLYFSFKYLPVSIAYTVFTGAGTAGAVIINIIFFKESKNWPRIASLIAIIVGVTGLQAVAS